MLHRRKVVCHGAGLVGRRDDASLPDHRGPKPQERAVLAVEADRTAIRSGVGLSRLVQYVLGWRAAICRLIGVDASERDAKIRVLRRSRSGPRVVNQVRYGGVQYVRADVEDYRRGMFVGDIVNRRKVRTISGEHP